MRALVTGAGRGIGRAICLRLASDGQRAGKPAEIVACDLRHDTYVDELVELLKPTGAKVELAFGDMADPATPDALVAKGIAAFGGLDAVVSNAGITAPVSLLEMTVEAWDRMMAINTRAGWLLGRAAHGALKASKGAMVATCSMSGMNPHSGMGAYSASKAAMIMLTRQMAQEWAADGIRVNAVSPGMVHTTMSDAIVRDPAMRAAREKIIPLGHIADPLADIAGVVAFLLGPDSRYMTGQNLLADGGYVESHYTHIPGRSASINTN